MTKLEEIKVLVDELIAPDKYRTQVLYHIDSDDGISYSTWKDEEITTRYFVASRVIAHDHGDWETMIFPANEEGEITDYLDLWSTRGYEEIGQTVLNWTNFMDGK